jgi:hypothetical protein
VWGTVGKSVMASKRSTSDGGITFSQQVDIARLQVSEP